MGLQGVIGKTEWCWWRGLGGVQGKSPPEEETQLGVECQSGGKDGMHAEPHSHDKSEILPPERGHLAWL